MISSNHQQQADVWLVRHGAVGANSESELGGGATHPQKGVAAPFQKLAYVISD